jgi:hypothetical protein
LKKLILTGLVGLGLVVGANASETRDATINIYGVGAKVDSSQNSSAGMGLMYDSEVLKAKVEATSDFVRTGAVLKLNPLDDENLYFKFGLNYLNQKVWSVVNTSTRVNQYSGSFATGYMISDDFYAEIGGSYTKLSGEVFGDYEIRDEKTSLGYIELAKRWESGIGTIDTTANAGKVFHEFRDDEASYGVGIEYYPMDNAKLAYAYQYEEDNIINRYSAQYEYVFVEYVDNISSDTYQVNAGIKIAFDNLFDISTWRMPSSIKPHLSELNRFENIVLAQNMALASSAGVEKTHASIDRASLTDTPEIVTPPAISTPTISMSNQTVNDYGGSSATDLPAPTVSDVQSGAVYSIVNDPTSGMLTINSSTGVATWNGDVFDSQNYSITIKVVNPDGGTSSTTFTLTVINNL